MMKGRAKAAQWLVETYVADGNSTKFRIFVWRLVHGVVPKCSELGSRARAHEPCCEFVASMGVSQLTNRKEQPAVVQWLPPAAGTSKPNTNAGVIVGSGRVGAGAGAVI
ncbi:Hypothetical predicted protein [Olea europaea subsp. europaea]|uniref:Uncharacterized protein n=1 Tax=Olea europaea subsp. europaea TaxID=158383 RepID=A0A8S0QFJ5_OLEEU|nr:Hypothetical predicted protein [Olea europaea subsp. europaea]